MQLVAYGAQDIYLTGNPQITFFKVVYRRHTNFSMEAIEQTWDGISIGSGVRKGGRCSSTISRNGDLIHRMYIEIVVGTTDYSVPSSVSPANPMAAAISDVELEIGGQRIDKHSGQWLEIWAELTQHNPSNIVMDKRDSTTGTPFQRMSGMGGVAAYGILPTAGHSMDAGHYFIPLQFWFCRNAGLALPLIALQYHEVKVILNHKFGNDAILSNTLFVDYIYLDTDERRRFAQVSHEYLIEQVQEQTGESPGSNELFFNHPVKEIIWTSYALNTDGFYFYGFNGLPTGDWEIKLNGHNRIDPRHYKYFTRTQIWQHHTGPGGLFTTMGVLVEGAQPPIPTTENKLNDTIAVYSFSLKPEEHQPSGTCNFSRIDTAELISSNTSVNRGLNIFAVNYNVLRIMSGMGGLAYSN